MDFFHSGSWQSKRESFDVTNPATGDVVDRVPAADVSDVDAAIDHLDRVGRPVMARMPAHQRAAILLRASQAIGEQSDLLARTISSECGKTIREARGEVARAAEVMRLSGEEAKRINGEVLPLDAAAGGEHKLGFTLRVPCGVVAAITPFNFPLNLVCHKVGPAIAAGNAVLIKPASDTPLSSLKLVGILIDSGLPASAIACLTGGGGVLGQAICGDDRIRKISFTGSQVVGEAICRSAGLKRVTMELGSNSPLVVLPDADLDAVVAATVASGFANAGQVCISAQRLVVDRSVHDDFLQRLLPAVEAIRLGDPLDEHTDMGPLIRRSEADRVRAWLDEATTAGAHVATGGEQDGAFVRPAVITDANSTMKIVRDELFGPAVAVQAVADVDTAIAAANDTSFGLSAAVFTRDLDAAMRFARNVDSGNIHINGGPMWRSDLMPYGGVKNSGIGKEGPRYTIAEMTETKMIVLHLGD
ncbi:aldehyde dehydrogenase family protein [Crateriforma conspicua]|uniref:Succinate-semialdehyde dehydrogenase [NADP(+)] GabD n=1 Tax=Crateriforma conspicua TaxID=2527996 RepID=A0A5C5Y1B6_9PLAN|nr:aldehyde dehydrogenase family protein [Crateriforma conspicua]TWT68421.1 Succinate-semialdehyde dehydrogenase [NADP(+)] GabD [Crateriforma conspicua]